MAAAKPDQNGIIHGTAIWVLVCPDGLYYAGLHQDESDVWQIALGWPDQAEITEKKRLGWYAAPVTARWERPA